MKNLITKIPVTQLIFIAFLLIFIPVFVLYSIYIDIVFANGSSSPPLFTIALLSKSFIKLVIVLYCILNATFLVRDSKHAAISTYILLGIILLSPLLIEIPFIILEIFIDSPNFVFEDILNRIPITAIFSISWFLYFRKARKFKT